MARYLFILFVLFQNFLVIAQDEKTDKPKFCKEDIDKKALSFYEKGTNRKKYQKQERIDFLVKSLQIDPEFTEANLAMGLELAGRCKLLEKPFTPTLPFFYKAIAYCPNIHSEPYYYLAFEYYEKQRNDSAIKYLKKFIDFKDDDEKKFATDYSGELYNAKMMLKSAKKEISLKRNVPFSPKVVRGVSTERDEYLAYISPDDKSCYFVRRVPAKNMDKVFSSDKEQEMFMVSKRDKTQQFNNGDPMDAPFNQTEDNQGGCSISIDNKRLYFAMMKQEGGLQPNCDIYVCEYTNDSWGEIRKVSPLINDPKYWDSQPTIASDGITLYFASDRPGGYGGIDIYTAKRDPKTNTWSVPQNLGPNINTKGDEKTPFIHSDSETLYFSSNGHYGFGGYDIFYVRKNQKGEWDEPENIGSPINGPEDDAGFLVSTDSQTGYFFSFDEGKVKGKGVGRYDMYGFELYKEARPQEVGLVKGVAKKDSTPVTKAVIKVMDLKSKKITYATVDSSNGEYMIAVKKESNLMVTVKKDSIAFNSYIVHGKDTKPITEEPLTVNLQVAEAKEGNAFIINNIYYKTNSADLEDESRLTLEAFARYLKENPKMKIEIQGHTDNVGNPKDNEALSTNRAFSVKAAIEEFGIDGHRITAKGYGSAQPVADNSNEYGRAKNRRTEFLIVSQ